MTFIYKHGVPVSCTFQSPLDASIESKVQMKIYNESSDKELSSGVTLAVDISLYSQPRYITNLHIKPETLVR